jgi:phosphoribosyl 1,2-cyclic phosphodiesterase
MYSMNKKYIELPKGGIIIDTTIGPIQLGVPPETIKDSLSLGREVPSIYIATKNLFSRKTMASFIDVEFPGYYNFFVNKKSIIVFCTSEQKSIIEGIMQESFFGPSFLNLEMEYSNGKNNFFFPDMRKEMDYFAKHPVENRQMNLNDIISFVILQDGKTIEYEGIKILLNILENKILITDKETFSLPWNLDINEIKPVVQSEENIFLPPAFGITTLGSSHGFDPKGKTSGFIFWINGSGIMIDPPIDSALWLLEENIDPRMLNSVILTHCHADHDSGVMQKILQEGRITLYTTPTVFSSFIKKISLLTGLTEIDIVELIEFIPISIDKPININGAMFTFNYRLHSIPTIGFEVYFKGKTVVYTSDHLNDKNVFDKLYKENILSEGRYQELCNFNWNKDIIIHEAGVPPIHTPIENLLALPEDIKKNIYLVHTEKERLPVNCSMTVSSTGLSNTKVISVDSSIHAESVQMLNLISGLDIFENLKLEKAAELLSIIKYRTFEPGECLIKEGEEGKRFYIIVAGRAKITTNNVGKATIGSGSYFGENAIVFDLKTTSTVIASTKIVTISIEKQDFLLFISNTPIYEQLKKLGTVRNLGSWHSIEANKIFRTMTINQKNSLESLFEYQTGKENEVIFLGGKPLDFSIIWNSGKASLVDENGQKKQILKSGDFIGGPSYLLGEKIPQLTMISDSASSYFKIKWQEMLKYFQKNPRLLLELKDIENI